MITRTAPHIEVDTLRLQREQFPRIRHCGDVVSCDILSNWPGHCEELPVFCFNGIGKTAKAAWKAAYGKARSN